MTSFLSGQFQTWHLYAVVALQSVFAALLWPAFQSSMTLLIPDKHRDRANAINQMTGPMAGVFAPALATALYALVNVGGVVAIDMISFVVAGLAPLIVVIPRPTESTEGREMRGSVLQEIKGGFRFLWTRKILLFLVLYASGVNFLFNGVLTLNTPYMLARSNGDPALLGIATSLMSVGGIAGGIIMGIWGGTRPRIHTIFPGLIISGIALALYGLSQSPVTLSLSLFAVMFPLPFVNAAFFSILQIKVPSDLQGRVFALVTQLAMLLSPLANLLVGPLADRVFEPAVGAPGWNTVASLVGNSHGAGMGLIAVIGGASLTVLSTIVYAIPATRRMEQTLPDYKPNDTLIEPTPIEPSAEAQPSPEPSVLSGVAGL
jgi:MFS family permease